MISIILDINSYIVFKQGRTQAVEIIKHAQKIGINAVVIGELLAGFAVGKRKLENQRELKRFLNTARVTLLSFMN